MSSLDLDELHLQDLILGLCCCLYLRGIRRVKPDNVLEEAIVHAGREALELFKAQGVDPLMALNINPIYGGSSSVRQAITSCYFTQVSKTDRGVVELDFTEDYAHKILEDLPGAKETYEWLCARVLEQIRY